MKKQANEFSGHLNEDEIRKLLMNRGIDVMKKRAGYIPNKTTERLPKKKQPALDYYSMINMNIGQNRLFIVKEMEHTAIRRNAKKSYSVVIGLYGDIPF